MVALSRLIEDTLVNFGVGFNIVSFLTAFILCLITLSVVPIIGLISYIIRVKLAKIIRKGALLDYVTFPGVMIHEISHALAVFITGAKIVSISLFKPRGNSLGCVTFIPQGKRITRSLQLALTACAPCVVCSITAILCFYKAVAIWPSLFVILWAYIGLCSAIHAGMSGADMKCYAKGLVVIAPIMYLICLLVVFSR